MKPGIKANSMEVSALLKLAELEHSHETEIKPYFMEVSVLLFISTSRKPCFSRIFIN